MTVESVEMTRDYRDWNSERQNASDGTRWSDHPAERAHRHLVSVADRCHGDDGPPERIRDAVDLRALNTEFGVIDGAGVDQQADDQGNKEQSQASHARLERQNQHLQH